MEGEGGPLSPGDKKVPDGVRYHVLDVWNDELWGVVGEDKAEKNVVELLMEPVERLLKEGRGKVVRTRAREVLEDERVRGAVETGNQEDGGIEEDKAWQGFDD